MDQQLVNRKILSVKRCIERIEENLPSSVETLSADIDQQDILSINLQRAVQLCVDLAVMNLSNSGETIPDSMAAAFRVLERQGAISSQLADSMVSAVGFRNLSVHQYDNVDWNVVYAICTKHLTDLKGFVGTVGSSY